MAIPWRAGHIITATRLNSALGTVTGRQLTFAGTVTTIPGTGGADAETDIPKLSILDYPVLAGRWYKFELNIEAQDAGALNVFVFRVRHSTAVSGTELFAWRLNTRNADANQVNSASYVGYWKALADNSALDFFVSGQHVDTASDAPGALSILGYSHTSFAITDIGDIATFVENI